MSIAIGDTLKHRKVHAVIDCTAINFSRRRYGGKGGTTYTWCDAFIDEDWVSLGDPWPCIRPKNTEIVTALQNTTLSMSNANT